MRFTVQRFPIVPVSICHTWLGQKENEVEQQRGRGEIWPYSHKVELTFLLLDNSCSSLFSVFNRVFEVQMARKDGRYWAPPPPMHLQLMVHSYSVEAWPIHLHSYTFRYANISTVDDSLLKQKQANQQYRRKSARTHFQHSFTWLSKWVDSQCMYVQDWHTPISA